MVLPIPSSNTSIKQNNVVIILIESEVKKEIYRITDDNIHESMVFINSR